LNVLETFTGNVLSVVGRNRVVTKSVASTDNIRAAVVKHWKQTIAIDNARFAAESVVDVRLIRANASETHGTVCRLLTSVSETKKSSIRRASAVGTLEQADWHSGNVVKNNIVKPQVERVGVVVSGVVDDCQARGIQLIRCGLDCNQTHSKNTQRSFNVLRTVANGSTKSCANTKISWHGAIGCANLTVGTVLIAVATQNSRNSGNIGTRIVVWHRSWSRSGRSGG
jgi:hypothetical protein